MAIIRNVRGGTVGLNEEDRLMIARLLVKAGYTVKIGYRTIPGNAKGKKEYIVEYWEEKDRWIPISERLPEDESYILVSFENATMPDIARYEENDEGGTFYPGDDEKSYSSYGIFVNAWTPLPEPCREEDN